MCRLLLGRPQCNSSCGICLFSEAVASCTCVYIPSARIIFHLPCLAYGNCMNSERSGIFTAKAGTWIWWYVYKYYGRHDCMVMWAATIPASPSSVLSCGGCPLTELDTLNMCIDSFGKNHRQNVLCQFMALI